MPVSHDKYIPSDRCNDHLLRIVSLENLTMSDRAAAMLVESYDSSKCETFSDTPVNCHC